MADLAQFVNYLYTKIHLILDITIFSILKILNSYRFKTTLEVQRGMNKQIYHEIFNQQIWILDIEISNDK